MVDRLLGVVHGAREIGYRSSRGISIKPSEGIKEALQALPERSKVGIEYHPAIARPRTFIGEKIDFSSSVDYWQSVIGLCDKSRLDVVYLDNPKMVVKTAHHQIEAARDGYMAHWLLSTGKKGSREYAARAYWHQVIANHTLEVQRERHIVKYPF